MIPLKFIKKNEREPQLCFFEIVVLIILPRSRFAYGFLNISLVLFKPAPAPTLQPCCLHPRLNLQSPAFPLHSRCPATLLINASFSL